MIVLDVVTKINRCKMQRLISVIRCGSGGWVSRCLVAGGGRPGRREGGERAARGRREAGERGVEIAKNNRDFKIV